MSTSNDWIGVDLDGTLARYDGWNREDHIGSPIPLMVDRVKLWLAQGIKVRIFTARVTQDSNGSMSQVRDVHNVRTAIEQWCLEHVGAVLPITNVKDFGMVELWDDRCVQVIPNTGERVGAVGVGKGS